MNTKLKAILALGCVSLACLAISGCNDVSKIDEYKAQGYEISVSYDANGGKYLGREGVTIVDMFNPDDFTADAGGTVHVKLMEPTDPARPKTSSESIKLTKQGYSLAGWYQSREIVKNAQDEPIDDNGNALEEDGGNYYLKGTKISAVPAYRYDGYWDFSTDTVDYKKGDGGKDLTLYAGWIPYYEFNYYVENGEGEWESYATTTFDYVIANGTDPAFLDRDTIWLPDWQEGAMNYKFVYGDKSAYNFPKLDGKTFVAAYTDPEKTSPITATFEHTGSLDIDHGQAVDRIQKIYVEFEVGERYKISTAEEFVSHVSFDGVYEILADLDFAGVTWPAGFCQNEFNGKIIGNGHTIKNVSAKFTSETSVNGGMFGAFGKNAVVSDITFKDVTFTLSKAGGRLTDTAFGTFVGYIDDGATLTDVTFDGATFVLGPVNLSSGFEINLVATGDLTGVTVSGETHLIATGQKIGSQYNFTVKTDEVVVNADNSVTLSFVSINKQDTETITIK